MYSHESITNADSEFPNEGLNTEKWSGNFFVMHHFTVNKRSFFNKDKERKYFSDWREEKYDT